MFFKSETTENQYIFLFQFRQRSAGIFRLHLRDSRQREVRKGKQKRIDYSPDERFFCSESVFRSQNTPSTYP